MDNTSCKYWLYKIGWKRANDDDETLTFKSYFSRQTIIAIGGGDTLALANASQLED